MNEVKEDRVHILTLVYMRYSVLFELSFQSQDILLMHLFSLQPLFLLLFQPLFLFVLRIDTGGWSIKGCTHKAMIQ